ncbi:hypothetical protein EDD86DRAFT_246183 [Gorgonomyces haynaldii]|nr:hypothetical protein EDD86DRAFT_246183 [Gorgonomyces haynaldii]
MLLPVELWQEICQYLDEPKPESYVKFLQEYDGFEEAYPIIKEWVARLHLSSLQFHLDGNTVEEIKNNALYHPNASLDMKLYLLLSHFIRGEHFDRNQSNGPQLLGFFGGYFCYTDICVYTWSHGPLNNLLSQDFYPGSSGDHGQFEILEADKYGTKGGHILLVFYGSSRLFVDFGPFRTFFESRLRALDPEMQRHTVSLGAQVTPPIGILPMYSDLDECCASVTTVIDGIGTFVIETGTSPATTRMEQDTLLHTYRIIITVLDLLIPSVQLDRREWDIRYSDGSFETVNGSGVIGEYPKFTAVGQEHKYSSYCGGSLDRQPHLMTGHLIFVPGTLNHRTGREFKIKVPNMLFRKFQTMG